jgi:hypothetical protein
MDDLTDRLTEAQDEEERKEVLRRWAAGRSSTRDEIEEITTKIAQQATGAPMTNGTSDALGSERPIQISLNGFDPKTKKQTKDVVQTVGGRTGPDSVSLSPGGASNFLERQFGIPGMWVDDEALYFAPPGGDRRVLSAPSPSDPEAVSGALEHLERFFETVDEHGQTNSPEAVKAHMLEALLYFFWAPFASLQAETYYRSSVPSLDKRLPFLYLQGESNSGKGTLLEFGLRLISSGAVTMPLDADGFGITDVRKVRQAASVFPVAVDDIEKSKIHQLDPLRNYWSDWEPGRRFPTLVFTSNDRRPNAWFRNRAKILKLDVRFSPSPAAEGEVQQIIRTPNPLFGWIAHRLLTRFQADSIELADDVLAPVRKALLSLYEEAGREAPGYLSQVPAENRYDPGREEWRRLARNGEVHLRSQGETLYVTFDGELEHWEIAELGRKLPTRVRADQEGHRLVIRSPDAFEDWLGDIQVSWTEKIRGLFG